MEEEHQEPPKPSPPNPKPSPQNRDFLLHLEAYLARRDGVDKLLKISRYAAKIALSSPLPLPETLTPPLRSFESSVGLSRKAFRLGKFVQDLNSLRSAAGSPSQTPAADLLLSVIAFGGEGVYYFVEQFVWLSKTGLLPSRHSRKLSRISAWAELVGYFGSIAMKIRDLNGIRLGLESADGDGEEKRRLKEKLIARRLSIVQDFADCLMVVGDVADGKGVLSNPFLMASAGLLSALISTQKNWASC